jgi:argonaute-like protein implicated in RNA metabolism and viral defense
LSSISNDKIFINLTKIDPDIGKIYHSAIAVLEDKNNPDRVAQSAHSIRETLNRLTGNIDIEYEKKKLINAKKKDTLKQKLIKTFDPLGIINFS